MQSLINDPRLRMVKSGAPAVVPPVTPKPNPFKGAPVVPGIAPGAAFFRGRREAKPVIPRMEQFKSEAGKTVDTIRGAAPTATKAYKAVDNALGNAGYSAIDAVAKHTPVIGTKAVDARAARAEAGTAAGLHPILSNMTGSRGALYGSVAGAALGALDPGKDKDGEENSSVGGALRGAVKGSIVGGGAGLLARHGYVNDKIAPHLPAAQANVAAQRAGLPATHETAALPPVTTEPTAATTASAAPQSVATSGSPVMNINQKILNKNKNVQAPGQTRPNELISNQMGGVGPFQNVPAGSGLALPYKRSAFLGLPTTMKASPIKSSAQVPLPIPRASASPAGMPKPVTTTPQIKTPIAKVPTGVKLPKV